MHNKGNAQHAIDDVIILIANFIYNTFNNKFYWKFLLSNYSYKVYIRIKIAIYLMTLQ